MSNKTVFISRRSHNDAEAQAKMQGYIPIGRGMRPNGEFIIFAEKARPFRR